jgi:hypothetical protein
VRVLPEVLLRGRPETIKTYNFIFMCRDSSVGIEIRLWAGRSRDWGSVTGKAKRFLTSVIRIPAARPPPPPDT